MHGADPGLNGKLELLNLAEAELRAPIWIDLEENSCDSANGDGVRRAYR
ncbi:hypothetical protein BFJ63_vAg18669 [Fusarium oxysporum f. sp. narcissi]|uniref:Uncharacterized protein n=1 Tax=Fusarium oxysporum f. sp. narcissi TaxID=451672 RepID=A0A4Q2V132_FUSOX|nr:hypothetical protein BFJ63_vAg18669 [Fusarium oxysporum f. sp. narcissi]